MDGEIPSLQQSPPWYIIIPVSFDIGSLVAKDIEKIWRDACTKLDNEHKGKFKLNDRIMEIKKKQVDGLIPKGCRYVWKKKQDRRPEHKARTKSEISALKREYDDWTWMVATKLLCQSTAW